MTIKYIMTISIIFCICLLFCIRVDATKCESYIGEENCHFYTYENRSIDMVVGRVMHSVVAFKEMTMSYLAC